MSPIVMWGELITKSSRITSGLVVCSDVDSANYEALLSIEHISDFRVIPLSQLGIFETTELLLSFYLI